MAILLDKGLLSKISGAIGKQFVIKQYKDKVVITAYPVLKKKKPSKTGTLKKLYEDDFAKAVKYAQGINNDPSRKASYQHKVKPGQSFYHYAISEYKKLYGVKPDVAKLKKRGKK